MSRIHIIACGGAVMHNIAIALHLLGHQVTGSDDEIFEPALSRLQKHNLLPSQIGWNENKIDPNIDFIILGMHARKENPELRKAIQLNLKIYSFPDYIYEHAKNKMRIVIGGSHGKTTSTAMLMHVLKDQNIDFDYLVGSQLDGFDTMVKFSEAPIMVIEGDEYLTSALDPVPKFHKYMPHIAMITGISWDHINVFPTFENYILQFKIFIDLINKEGKLIFFKDDSELLKLTQNIDVLNYSYQTPMYHIRNGKTIISKAEKYTLDIFGEHNLQNSEGVRLICKELGINEKEFYASLSTFKGTSKRLEKVYEDKETIIFRDFAHSPSKLKASINAIKNQFPEHLIISIYELHTFSSLNKNFFPEYQGTMENTDEGLIYFNPEVIKHKKLEPIDNKEIRQYFGEKIAIIQDSKKILEKISEIRSNYIGKPCVLLFMSSGNFDNTKLW
ncbi:MAG: Mur ligase family protein [Bacteroidota bacterium]|nr:Mur ligase family protein [Bacteroidota bacterium]